MTRARVVLGGAVVHSGEVVVFVVHGMGRNRVRHLRRRIEVERRVVGNHAAKQCHVHRRIGFKRRLTSLFVELAALGFNRDVGQRVQLALTYEEQRIRFQNFFIFLICFRRYSRGVDNIQSQRFCIKLRIARAYRVGQQRVQHLGTLTDFFLGQHIGKTGAHCFLPALR